jgi:hypothetical protein
MPTVKGLEALRRALEAKDVEFTNAARREAEESGWRYPGDLGPAA